MTMRYLLIVFSVILMREIKSAPPLDFRQVSEQDNGVNRGPLGRAMSYVTYGLRRVEFSSPLNDFVKKIVNKQNFNQEHGSVDDGRNNHGKPFGDVRLPNNRPQGGDRNNFDLNKGVIPINANIEREQQHQHEFPHSQKRPVEGPQNGNLGNQGRPEDSPQNSPNYNQGHVLNPNRNAPNHQRRPEVEVTYNQKSPDQTPFDVDPQNQRKPEGSPANNQNTPVESPQRHGAPYHQSKFEESSMDSQRRPNDNPRISEGSRPSNQERPPVDSQRRPQEGPHRTEGTQPNGASYNQQRPMVDHEKRPHESPHISEGSQTNGATYNQKRPPAVNQRGQENPHRSDGTYPNSVTNNQGSPQERPLNGDTYNQNRPEESQNNGASYNQGIPEGNLNNEHHKQHDETRNDHQSNVQVVVNPHHRHVNCPNINHQGVEAKTNKYKPQDTSITRPAADFDEKRNAQTDSTSTTTKYESSTKKYEKGQVWGTPEEDPTTTEVDLDDRANFTAAGCAPGEHKVNGRCIPED